MDEFGAGNYAWVLVAAALVMFMVPGLALFYGGMVRGKNVLNMLLMNMVCLAVVPIVWVLLGYSLANDPKDLDGASSVIGGFDWIGLKDITAGGDIATLTFLAMFAVITPALISGAVADRMKFSTWAVFVGIWVLVVYAPVVYWIYGSEGWLLKRGSLDFAGGTAIHINAGVAALAMVLVLGKRKGWPTDAMPPHNMPLVILGTGILWFGWFGFNAGSALGANATAAQAFLNTFLAGAAGMGGWLIAERLKDGHFTTLGAASGVVAALVAITPAAGYVSGLAGIIFGLVAGVVCFYAISLKYRLGYDDSLDVVGIHGVGGVLGGLMLGLFADSTYFGEGTFPDGWFFGGGSELFVEQMIAIGAVIAFSFGVTFVIARVLDATMGLRVNEDDEAQGLDLTAHAESGYALGETASMGRV